MLTQSYDEYIKKDFGGDQLSDFTIVCRDKTFYVHRFILRLIPYFKKVIDGHWQEGQKKEVNLSDGEPELIRSLLRFTYGYGYDDAIKNLDLCWSSEVLETLEEFKSILDDPPLDLSNKFCHILMQDVRVFFTAEFYDLEPLKTEAFASFKSHLHNCWNSKDLLDVVQFVYQKSAGLNDLRKHLAKQLAMRGTMVKTSAAFTSLALKFPHLALDIAHDLLERQPWLSTEEQGFEVRYCSYITCRRNVAMVLRDGSFWANDVGEPVEGPPIPKCSCCQSSSTLKAARTSLFLDEE